MHVDRGLVLLARCRGPHLHLPFRGGVVAVFACAHKLSIGTANQPTNPCWAFPYFKIPVVQYKLPARHERPSHFCLCVCAHRVGTPPPPKKKTGQSLSTQAKLAFWGCRFKGEMQPATPEETRYVRQPGRRIKNTICSGRETYPFQVLPDTIVG